MHSYKAASSQVGKFVIVRRGGDFYDRKSLIGSGFWSVWHQKRPPQICYLVKIGLKHEITFDDDPTPSIAQFFPPSFHHDASR